MSRKEISNVRLNSPLTALIMAHGMAAAATAQTGGNPATPKPGSTPTNTSTNAPAKLPEVVVEGTRETEPGFTADKLESPKYTQPLRDTPQTINVVPRALIEAQGATTLRDVLRNVPGISFQAGEGGVPAGDQLSIRGFSARTDLFVDGVRDIGGYTRDSFNLEQVEITKGPNSSYSGRGSTGGGVNMVSKVPKLDAAYATDIGYGTDQYYRLTGDINQPLTELAKVGIEGAAIRVNALYHDQDFAGRDYIHDQRWAFAPSLALGLGTDTRAYLTYMHLKEDNVAGYGLPFVSANANPFGGASAVGHIAPLPYESFLGLKNRDYEEVTNDAVGARLEHDFSDDVKLRHQTRYVRTYRDSIITAPRIITNPAANADYQLVTVGANTFGLNHELQSRDQVDEIITTQTDLTTKFDTWKLEHTLVTSFEYSRETSVNYLRSAGVTPWVNGATFYPAPLDNPFNPRIFGIFGPVNRTGARNEAVTDSFGISAGDTIKITDQWLLNLSMRVDTFDVTYNQYNAAGALTSFSRFDAAPTWRTGLTYKPVEYGSIYFSYANSFNPSAEGLTLATTTVNLEPEYSDSFELGTKWDLFQQRLSTSFALFRTDKSNFRTTDPVTTIVSTTGEVRVQGAEIGISGKITDKWMVYGGYALMESKVLKSTTTTTFNGVAGIREQGKELSNTPEQTASISTTYALPKRVTIGTGIQFTDKRYANNFNTLAVDGYWLQDAMVSWQVNDHFSLRLNGMNLWDKEYIDRVGGGHAIPGAGRTYILTASLKF